MVIKAFKFRLRPTAAQRVELDRTLDTCRELYNAGLQEKRDAYQLAGITRSCVQQQAELTEIKVLRPDVGLVHSQVLQDVLKRLHRAFDGFFRRVKTGAKPGYPRFKSRDRYDSFTFPRVTHKGVLKSGGITRTERGRLKVHGLPGELKVIWHRAMLGRPKTATFKREGAHWYVVFVCDQVPVEARERTGADCGIDVGLTSFATFDDGAPVPNPRFLRQSARELKLAARNLAKKRKRSNRRKRARARLASAHRRVANRRRNFHHQTARAIVRRFDRIGVEDLNIRGLARGMLSKSVHAAGWAQFLAILISKAAGASCEVVKVPARGTTQECAGCGGVVPKSLKERIHRCPRCGFVAGRDVNAALNIRMRAFGTGPGSGPRRGASRGARGSTRSDATDDPRSPCR